MKEERRNSLSIPKVFSSAKILFLSNARLFLSISLISTIFAFFKKIYVMELYSQNWILYFILNSAIWPFFIASFGVLSFVVMKRAVNEDVTLISAFKNIKFRFIKYLVVCGLLNIMQMIGFVLFIIPGFLLSVFFIFAEYFAIIENKKITDCFVKSAELVRNNSWQIFVILMSLLLFYVPVLILGLLKMSVFVKYSISASYSLILFVVVRCVLIQTFIDLKKLKSQDIIFETDIKERKNELIQVVIFGLISVLVISGWFVVKSKRYYCRGNVCPISEAPIINEVDLVANFPELESNIEYPQIIDQEKFLFYIPSGIDLSKKYPLLVCLMPNGNVSEMISYLKDAVDKHKWIVYGAKTFSNEGIMYSQLNEIAAILGWAKTKLPIDEEKIIATGFSGGGMGAYSFAYEFPGLISAIIVNTAMMPEVYIKENADYYPEGKLAVFLASPTDFRYDEMQQDKKFLDNLGWQIKWIEFVGGHRLANKDAWIKASDWLDGAYKTSDVYLDQDDYFDPDMKNREEVVDGLIKDYYDNGNLSSEINYEKGKKQGLYRAYYEDGHLWVEGNYDDDLKNHIFTIYNQDGTMQSQTSYLMGFKNGDQKRYSLGEILDNVIVYENGFKIWEKNYDSNGNLKSEIPFLNNQLHGISKIYNENGKVIAELEYKNGKRVNPVNHFFQYVKILMKRNKK